jgi:anti-sigma factor RsiW
MTCRECAEFLSDYLAGELAADVRAAFEHHLSICPNCVTYLEQVRETVRAGRLAFEDDTEPDVPEDLVRAILAARRAGSPPGGRQQ